ncbi:unnamed protein product [Anisakis simplex]|uniref:Uncharacterized protein n=1 Tax=Anisakis simplex TaxID=6269 RepID=A0A0M3K6D5_ANISI|nr:unnamed protein product [Anisakis simplex]
MHSQNNATKRFLRTQPNISAATHAPDGDLEALNSALPEGQQECGLAHKSNVGRKEDLFAQVAAMFDPHQH